MSPYAWHALTRSATIWSPGLNASPAESRNQKFAEYRKGEFCLLPQDFRSRSWRTFFASEPTVKVLVHSEFRLLAPSSCSPIISDQEAGGPFSRVSRR